MGREVGLVGPERRDEGPEGARVEPGLEEGGGRVGCRGEGGAHEARELDEDVAPLLDQQVLPHLEREAEDGLEVGPARRLQQLADRAQRVLRHRLLGLLGAQPGQQLRGHRPVPHGRGLRERRAAAGPTRPAGRSARACPAGAGRRPAAPPGAPPRARSPRWPRRGCRRSRPCGGASRGRPPAAARPCSGSRGPAAGAAAPPTSSPARRRACAPRRGRAGRRASARGRARGRRPRCRAASSKGWTSRTSGPKRVEHRAEAVAVVGDQRPHDLVRGVVEREAARGADEGEHGRVRGDGVRGCRRPAAPRATARGPRARSAPRRAASAGRPRRGPSILIVVHVSRAQGPGPPGLEGPDGAGGTRRQAVPAS